MASSEEVPAATPEALEGGEDQDKKDKQPGGPTLPRERISTHQHLGQVLDWRGNYGWIMPMEPIRHPKASMRQGRIFISRTDLANAKDLMPGTFVQFQIFEDEQGLGAEKCYVWKGPPNFMFFKGKGKGKGKKGEKGPKGEGGKPGEERKDGKQSEAPLGKGPSQGGANKGDSKGKGGKPGGRGPGGPPSGPGGAGRGPGGPKGDRPKGGRKGKGDDGKSGGGMRPSMGANTKEGKGGPAQGHRGTLPAFKLGPVENLKPLTSSEEKTLEQGKLVLRQEEDPTRGKGLAIRDMAATPDDVMEELLDFSTYKKKVAMCSSSIVYGRKKLRGGKEQIKVEMSSTIIPGFSFHCYFDHTADRKGHSMIWSLDYDRRSDVDDIKGMWYVEPHPTKEGWSRVYYQIDMRLRVAAAAQALEDAVTEAKAVVANRKWEESEATARFLLQVLWEVLLGHQHRQTGPANRCLRTRSNRRSPSHRFSHSSAWARQPAIETLRLLARWHRRCMAVRGDGVQRSPTFFVGAEKQKRDLDAFQRREQQLAEAYHKNKPLCFNSCAFQKTHPVKAKSGHRDADATLVSPMVAACTH
ncbi:unnamed protein product [Symbiodinium necroappetens]|uniref:Uncharacterized protein n=1 Tax=Symbiodinium necroappetens TaxID=1628268 RepID=A0A812SCF6_9DINO|nr:unnamed protein product [Symbiodinium necroappetens]